MNKILFENKNLEYYSGLLIRADKGLHDQIAEIIKLKVEKGAKILDMGAGQGALSARLCDLGYAVTAADINDDDYGLIGRDIKFDHVNFDDQKDLESFISQHESQFDVVCGVEVIEHVENAWAYVRGLNKLVKPSGFVLITTPNITSWLSRLIFLRQGQFLCFKEENLSYGHINPISRFELELIMDRSGLKEIEIFSAGTLPPLYFTSFKMIIFSLIALILRPFQSGILDGWCIIAIGRK